ncbi:MAG: heme-binding protein [Phycisphaerae bacterium]|nr:heme-binding protein [Phycisphaerae bacterium]
MADSVESEAGRAWAVREAALPEGFPEPQKLGEIAVRHYPAHRAAVVSGKGRSGGAFMQLFRHIKRNKIAMTAPVEQQLRADGRSLTSMAFYYGRADQGEVGPDQAVKVVDRPAMKVISIGFRGYATEQARATAAKQLLKWLSDHPELESCGLMRTMGYNSPFVPGMLRYWELQIPIRAKKSEGEAR